MRKVKISVDELSTAFDMVSAETVCFLDVESAEIETVNEYTMSREEIDKIYKAIDENPDRFIQIPENDPHERYEEMTEFADGVTDFKLRDKLYAALESKGPFRKFKDVLLNYPDERKEWFACVDEKIQQRVLYWLKENEIELTDKGQI